MLFTKKIGFTSICCKMSCIRITCFLRKVIRIFCASRKVTLFICTGLFVWFFFSNLFVTCNTANGKISLLFVALSHCDRQNFGLWHWATATNRNCVWCTESLWKTKLVYFTEKFQKTTKNATKCKIRHKVPKSVKKS